MAMKQIITLTVIGRNTASSSVMANKASEKKSPRLNGLPDAVPPSGPCDPDLQKSAQPVAWTEGVGGTNALLLKIHLC